MKELQGKVAVITGAAEGIGRAIAEQAAARGMKLVLADISEAKLNETVAALRAIDDGSEALVLSRNETGRPFRMHITDTRDMVAGILLTLSDERAAGRTYNLGATEPVDFAAALPMMAELTAEATST